MNFYAYIPVNGKEPLGTAGKFISRKYKSFRTFYKYFLGNNPKFRVYSFVNIYDESTFKLEKMEA